MFTQTTQPTGLRRERLYRAFLSAKDHAGMTADGVQLVTHRRRVVGNVEAGDEGDDLLAFGAATPTGKYPTGSRRSS